MFPPWTLVLFIAGPLCEETGWRGFLQPQLLRVTTPIKAALIIGVIWCLWHIPLSFTPGTTPPLDSVVSWVLYGVGTISASAMLMVIVVSGRGSIAAAMAFHWASNAALSQVVMPLYPDASVDAWRGVELIQLGFSVFVAAAMLAWLTCHTRMIKHRDLKIPGTHY